LPPLASISRCSSSQAASLREQSTTFAPASERASAKYWPKPRPPPVTTAVFPSRRNKSNVFIIFGSLLHFHLTHEDLVCILFLCGGSRSQCPFSTRLRVLKLSEEILAWSKDEDELDIRLVLLLSYCSTVDARLPHQCLLRLTYPRLPLP